MDNNEIEIDLPTTLERAILLDPRAWAGLGVNDVLIDPQTMQRTMRRWLWLRGVPTDADPALAVRVRAELASDAELWIALNLPATDFLTWLRRQDWEAFDGVFTDIDEDLEDATSQRDEVVWGIVDRAREAVQKLGALAGQSLI